MLLEELTANRSQLFLFGRMGDGLRSEDVAGSAAPSCNCTLAAREGFGVTRVTANPYGGAQTFDRWRSEFHSGQ
jgi:hypothetical protein